MNWQYPLFILVLMYFTVRHRDPWLRLSCCACGLLFCFYLYQGNTSAAEYDVYYKYMAVDATSAGMLFLSCAPLAAVLLGLLEVLHGAWAVAVPNHWLFYGYTAHITFTVHTLLTLSVTVFPYRWPGLSPVRQRKSGRPFFLARLSCKPATEFKRPAHDT